jgi:hypothetical protein
MSLLMHGVKIDSTRVSCSTFERCFEDRTVAHLDIYLNYLGISILAKPIGIRYGPKGTKITCPNRYTLVSRRTTEMAYAALI